MKQARQLAESGFTLVEMLVALSIFAALAAAGVGLLRSGVDTQNAVAVRLAGSGNLARLQALLASDVTHALAVPTSAEGKPAFVGGNGGFMLLRSGLNNSEGGPRSNVQQVEWRATAGVLVRAGRALGERPSPLARVIAAQSVRIRYRAATGLWADTFSSTPPEPLPQAVEVVLTTVGRPPVTIVVALPPRGLDGAPVKAGAAAVPA